VVLIKVTMEEVKVETKVEMEEVKKQKLKKEFMFLPILTLIKMFILMMYGWLSFMHLGVVIVKD